MPDIFRLPDRIIKYPAGAKTVVDVTQSPYCLDNTGQRDCTEKLIQIIDEITSASFDALQDIVRQLENSSDPNARLSFENRKENGKVIAIFPDSVPVNRIIYFPKGTYLISDTICYSRQNLTNTQSAELNWCLRFMGESRSETIIRLKDNSHGFEYGIARPVISFMRGKWSNIAMSNYFENITIDTGCGNPGAVGLEFFGNNCAAVRDVSIRSGDPQSCGHAGLSVSRETISACVFSNIEIDGFDYGIELSPQRTYVVFDNIHLRNQLTTGMLVKHIIAPVRKLFSDNSVPAVTITGKAAHVSLIDCMFTGGDSSTQAVDFQDGFLFAQNCKQQGYSCFIGERRAAICIVGGQKIDQYVSHPTITAAENIEAKSLTLSVKDSPAKELINTDSWADVDDFGAIADGKTDSTVAIQAAISSGKPVIYFQPGKYLIDAPIYVPASVRQINFMFTDIVAGENIKKMKNAGMFTINQDSDIPLFIEDLFSREGNFGAHYLLDHASRRTLVLSDLHSQSCAMYRNSVPGGEVFIDNVVSTPGIGPDKYWQSVFLFTGQKVWARQINAEYGDPEIINDGGELWVLGFKTEGPWVCFDNRNGGKCEILGGVLNIGNNLPAPAIVNNQADISVVASSSGIARYHRYPNVIENIRGDQKLVITDTELPERFTSQFTIPLFVG